jgi:ABC-2 type transport system permease protein
METLGMLIATEYLTRVRRLPFIIGTAIAPLLLLLYIAIPVMLTKVTVGKRDITVLDQSGAPDLFQAIKSRDGVNMGTKLGFLQRVIPPDQNIDDVRRALDAELVGNPEGAYIVLRPDVLKDGAPEYYGYSSSDLAIIRIEEIVSAAIKAHHLNRAGLDPDSFNKPVKMIVKKIGAGEEAGVRGLSVFIPFVIFLVTFLSIIGYGAAIKFAITEEKQSRVVEVIISSVDSYRFMMGKLIGVGLVSLTQFAAWGLSAMALRLSIGTVLGRSGLFQFPNLSFPSLIYVVLYFVLGYFLYASMHTVAGALSSDGEAKNFVNQFMFIIALGPLMTSFAVLRNPNSALAVTFSMFPFFTPGTMVLRLLVTQIPIWQILTSFILMLITIIGVVYVAAKIYRIGILMHGNKPNLIQVMRWLKYS